MTRSRAARWGRRLLAAAGLVALLLAAALVVLSLPSVQRGIWRRVVDRATGGTPWTVEASDVNLGLIGGTLTLDDLAVAHSGEPVLGADLVHASWHWTDLLSVPRRVERLDVEGATVDLRHLPEPSPDEAEQGKAAGLSLETVEIGQIDVGLDRLVWAEPGVVRAEAEGGELSGSLEGGRLRATADLGSLEAVRDGRSLSVADVRLTATVEGATMRVERLQAAGPALSIDASGTVELGDTPRVEAELEASAGLEDIADWWDPALAERLEPRGELELAGTIEASADGTIDGELRHTGEPLSIAGYPVSTLELEGVDGRPRLEVSSPAWGSIEAVQRPDDRIAVSASFDEAQPGPVADRLPPSITGAAPPDLTISGSADLVLGPPPDLLDPEAMEGEADLVAEWDGGRASLEALTTDEGLRFRRADLSLGGGRLTAEGTVSLEGELSATIDVQLPSLADAVDALRLWLPAGIGDLPVRGGPVELDATIGGTVTAPSVDGHLVWHEPSYGDIVGRRLEAFIEGTPDHLQWRVEAETSDDARLEADGTMAPDEPLVSGRWSLATAAPTSRAEVVSGAPFDIMAAGLRGRGRFEWRGGLGRGSATLVADELEAGPWRLDDVVADAELDQARLELRRLEARGFDGSLSASASLPLDGAGELTAELDIEGVSLAELPIDVPDLAAGTLEAHLEASGPASNPRGSAAIEWRPSAASSPLAPIRLSGGIASGRLRLDAAPIGLGGETVQASVVVPLGGLPSPAWLWPHAPSGPARVEVVSDRLHLATLTGLLGVGDLPVQASAGVRMEALWSLSGEGPRRAEVSLLDLTLASSMETLQAEGAVRLRLSGNRLVLEPFEITGEASHLAGRGRIELGADEPAVSARLDVRLAPSWLRLAPGDLDATGPVAAELSVGGTLDDLQAHAELNQLTGEILMREPPVQISALKLEVRLRDGVLSVPDGEATVNRGQVLIGGEWNPTTGQGIIFGIDDVAFLAPLGVLTRWEGAVVVEPAEDRLARIVGELTLVNGLWDQPIDLASMILGRGITTGGTTSELLYDVLLDLEVYASGSVMVQNNLGNFDVTWQSLNIEGTAADPQIGGELMLVPGGVISLAGRTMEIARGSVRFPAQPGAAPEIEVIPARQSMTAGESAGLGLDAEMVAREGIASSVGSVLGLTNETLEPATIAVETLTDPSTNYLVARQFGRHVALFLAADLTDVQQRTALLQAYNFREVPGLALQGIDDTRTGIGYAAIESLKWGGTVEDRPHIRRIRLEGEWPLSKRRLKKATHLRKGQIYDPFLVFVGRVRLERELAGAGYYRARVEGSVSQDQSLPGLSFTVDPGPHQKVAFRGDEIPDEVRRRAVAQYQPPPQEQESFLDMHRIIQQYLDANSYPFARVDVLREGDAVVVEVERCDEVVLEGPSISNVDIATEQTLQRLLGSPAELAELARDRPEARSRLERLLSLEGYLEPTVRRVRLERLEDSRMRVHVRVDHQGQAVIESFTVTGDDPLGKADPGELLVEEGMPLRRSVLDLTERLLRQTYREAGYTEAEVDTEVTGSGLSRSVTMTLTPGLLQHVGTVDISGRRHISEGVLRQGVELEPGDVFRRRELNESIIQLASFGPIARVDVETEEAGPATIDVDVQITERARWTAGVGARYGSDTGLLGLIDLRDDGLFGRGFSLDLRGLYGTDRRVFGLIGSLPRGPGGRWSTSLTLAWRREPSETDPDRVQQESRSASLEGTYWLTDQARVRGYYLFDDTLSSSLLVGSLPTVERTVQQSTLGWQGILDRLDDPLDPRRGYYLAADVGFSTPSLGGDIHALRTLVTATWASVPKEGWTWARSFRLGWARALDGDPLEEQVRFFAGGQSSIRGFDRNLVGPVAIRPDGSLRPLGGAALLVLNEEIRVPVYSHRSLGTFRIALFADIGQVWPSWSDADLSFAVGAGTGLRWTSPLGPIWFDVAWPVADVQGDRSAKFYIGIGRAF